MKYALVNDDRQEAQPGLSGKCAYCGNPTITKCGEVKIWHWAHKGKRMCDAWWENETPWHRAWKDCFPKEWQEVIHLAENEEKHRADVKIDGGYVIEFQHSLIKSEERKAREDFYKTMIWIVDGTRRSRDKDAFMDVWKYLAGPVDGRVELRRLQGRPVHKCTLLRDWDSSSVPVFFDFGEQVLLGLLPKTKEDRVHLCSVDRNTLITSLCPAPQVNSFEALLKGWNNLIATQDVQDAAYLRWRARGCPPMRRYL